MSRFQRNGTCGKPACLPADRRPRNVPQMSCRHRRARAAAGHDPADHCVCKRIDQHPITTHLRRQQLSETPLRHTPSSASRKSACAHRLATQDQETQRRTHVMTAAADALLSCGDYRRGGPMMTSHFKGVVKMPRRFFSATAALGTLALLAGTMLSSATSANELTGKGKRAPDARPTVILQRLAVPKRTRQ